jgi:ribosomal protein S18 acetylase RimI-like enzyme
MNASQQKSISIRPARASDAEFIVESQLAMAFESEKMQLQREVVQRGVKAALEDQNKGVYYIAERVSEGTSGNPRLGMLLTVHEWSEWRNGNVLWIHSVYTLPAYRKQGVYRALYRYLQQLVEAKLYLGLRLYVDRNNLAAQKAYKSLGMNGEHYDLYEWIP